MQAVQLDIGEILARAPAEVPDICRNRHKGNPESEAANLRTAKQQDRARIAAYLTDRVATCDQIEQALNMRHQTASARVSELLKDGLIERTGERRKTRTGCGAAVLRLKKEGE